jgi:hypothetical protein
MAQSGPQSTSAASTKPTRRPANTEKIQTRRKDYRFGFQAAAYTVLEEECPTINDAITLMHTSATSSENDILKWLFLSSEEKKTWDPKGYLEGF